jgi:hypothetical protein
VYAVREGRRHIRTRTLIAARRCLSALEDSISPAPASAAALATVMTQMAQTDMALAAMLGTLDRQRAPFDQHDGALRCGRGGPAKTER